MEHKTIKLTPAAPMLKVVVPLTVEQHHRLCCVLEFAQLNIDRDSDSTPEQLAEHDFTQASIQELLDLLAVWRAKCGA